MINYKLDEDFKTDKDLIKRDEPEHVAQLRKKCIDLTYQLQDLIEENK